jgi:NAD(P)H-hydrate repair Nnr-like enzyme with NAD(P)H-hydrate epimerase domain
MFNVGTSVADLIRLKFPTMRSVGIAAGDGFVAVLLLSEDVAHLNIFS